ncbi:DUF72 domain-containing protein [Spongisporangium articulatum]|uniref:DUF72 domain-containing protein n=1 Tax=Spongisporangium articulatum TaxID=3362603 RepID=A0ABW8AH95_9ACTN
MGRRGGRRRHPRRRAAGHQPQARRPPGVHEGDGGDVLNVRVGTSGFSYPHWKHVLYEGVPQRLWLERYAEEFDALELNGSFYHWPKDASFAAWKQRVPRGFRFAVKAPRGLTHARRLRSPEVWVERIVRSYDVLGAYAGPLLLQLPGTLPRDDAALDGVLRALPARVPAAVEFRHESWLHDDVFDLLTRRNAAYVVMSGAHLPCVLRRTSDLVYVRMHGPDPEHLYAGSYSDVDLGWWAERVREWTGAGAQVQVYFNNDGEGHAVRNAWTLKGFLA